MQNVYFDLTVELNRDEPIVALTSGQAVVYFRVAMMSKDGDWIVREAPGACARVLEVLASRHARYRPGAPLDVRWLGGGWSSHFEFLDERRRRVRCDFVSRPPRVDAAATARLFGGSTEGRGMRVVDLETLIRMKQTQRAKDYPVIGELARRLPPEREILYTTDPDRIIELASRYGANVDREPVQEALRGRSRDSVVVALAREIDRQQDMDRRRLAVYERAAGPYLRELVASGLLERPVREAHDAVVGLAERLLPRSPPDRAEGGDSAP